MAKGRHYRTPDSPSRSQIKVKKNEPTNIPEQQTPIETPEEDKIDFEEYFSHSVRPSSAEPESEEDWQSESFDSSDPKPQRHFPVVPFVILMFLAAFGIIGYMLVELGIFSNTPFLSQNTLETSTSQGSEESTPIEEATPSPSPTPSPTPTPEPTPPAIFDDGTDGYFSSNVCIYNNKGFQLFDANETSAQSYAELLNSFADTLPDLKLYSMVVPNSSEFGLPERIRTQHDVTPQKEYIESISNALSDRFTSVPIYDALNLHNNEAIYMGTDTYWTALGAYYAYEEFCAAAGCEPAPLDSFEEQTYQITGYLANLTGDTSLYNNPDQLSVYEPKFNYTCEVSQDGYYFSEQDSINLSDESLGYDMYNSGDKACIRVTNHDLSTGRKLLVIKDCFGSAFAPFLTASFDAVHTIDYRYFTANLSDYCAEQGITDVLFLDGTVSTDSDTQRNYLQNLFS